jgi:hypothetical protein
VFSEIETDEENAPGEPSAARKASIENARRLMGALH